MVRKLSQYYRGLVDRHAAVEAVKGEGLHPIVHLALGNGLGKQAPGAGTARPTV